MKRTRAALSQTRAVVEAARELERAIENGAVQGAQFLRAMLRNALRDLDAAQAGDTRAKPVCESCNDTHEVYLESSGRTVMCTRCPRPCDKCKASATDAYCWATPCPCRCHNAAQAGETVEEKSSDP